MKDTEKLFKEINEILEKSRLAQAQTIKRLNSIRSKELRTKGYKGYIDWDKLEFECTDKVYLKAKEDLKISEKFGNEMLLRMFERKNRVALL